MLPVSVSVSTLVDDCFLILSCMQAHSLDSCVVQGMDTYAFLLSQDGCGSNDGLEK